MNESLNVMMQDAEIRKAFGHRVKALRKLKNWSQKELGNRIGVSYAQINKYEGGTNVPPLDKMVALASVLETTIDYLATGELNEHPPIPNVRLMERFRELSTFDADDQEAIILLIDAVIVKHRVENAMQVSAPKKKAS